MRRLPMHPRTESALVVYRGPSMLDGAEIVAILTGLDGSSHNTKTGPMAQLWILPYAEAPHHAQKSGADASVCGDCPKRPSLPRAAGELPCYVKTYQGPRATWEKHKDAPVRMHEAMLSLENSDIPLRLGAYGDPAALPREVIEQLCGAARTHTGYTHQWRDFDRFGWLRHYVMASADSELDAWQAWCEGWRTFRTIRRDTTFANLGLPHTYGQGTDMGEIFCPAVSADRTCAQCRLCDGMHGPNDGRKSIAIFEH